MKEKYSKIIFDELEKLEIGGSFNKAIFIEKNMEGYNYYSENSFTVLLCRVKKLLPKKEFRTLKGMVTRII